MKETKSIKLLVIIILILIILSISYIFWSKAEKNQKLDLPNNGVLESRVNEYIGDIYYGIDTWLPTFKDINSANENWIWECAYNNLIKKGAETGSIITKEQIEDSAKEIFGNNLKKEFPVEGLEFWLVPQKEGYFVAAASVEFDYYYTYIISSIINEKNNIVVESIEYKFNDIWHGQEQLKLFNIKTNEEITKYNLKSDETNLYNDYLLDKQEEAKKFVMDNKEKFSTVKITLKQDKETGELYILSVER